MKTVLTGMAMVLLLAAGCSKAPRADDNPYAGLDDAIRAWKTDLSGADPSCRQAPAGEKCEAFDVSCKAQRVITPEDQGKGVTAKLVVHMSWSGFDAHGAPQPASSSALFTKAKGAWTRLDTKPVSPESCADLVASP